MHALYHIMQCHRVQCHRVTNTQSKSSKLACCRGKHQLSRLRRLELRWERCAVVVDVCAASPTGAGQLRGGRIVVVVMEGIAQGWEGRGKQWCVHIVATGFASPSRWVCCGGQAQRSSCVSALCQQNNHQPSETGMQRRVHHAREQTHSQSGEGCSPGACFRARQRAKDAKEHPAGSLGEQRTRHGRGSSKQPSLLCTQGTLLL